MNTKTTLLTISEIAEEYAVSRQTIWRYVKSSELQGMRIGHTFRVTRDSLDRFLNKCNQK